MKKFSKSASISCTVLLLFGCSTSPVPVENKQQFENTYTRLHQTIARQEKIGTQVTLAEAIARTLKYNLDHRVQKAQLYFEAGSLKQAYLQMLPVLGVDAGYSFRNNSLIQNNIDESGRLTRGSQSFTPQEITTASTGLQWNILDLGMSYTRAKQQANKVLIAKEQRRKITQQLTQEVINAYWKAWTAQQLENQLTTLKSQAEAALAKSRILVKEKVRPAMFEYNYQQSLLKSIRKATQLSREISSAKSNLVRLMNANPTAEFKLVEPQEAIATLPKIEPQLQQMDIVALINRPELREASYVTEIAKQGINQAMLNMLPGVNFDYGYNYTSNKFLLNNTWAGGNINLSWDLLNAVLKGPASISVAKDKHQLEKLKQLAFTSAVLSQIRISYTNYLQWREEYKYANEQANVTEIIYKNTANMLTAGLGTQQSLIQHGIEALVSRFESGLAYANAEDALSRLYQSVGVDAFYIERDQMHLRELTAAVEEKLILKSQGSFNDIIQQQYSGLEKLVADKGVAISNQDIEALQDSVKIPSPISTAPNEPVLPEPEFKITSFWTRRESSEELLLPEPEFELGPQLPEPQFELGPQLPEPDVSEMAFILENNGEDVYDILPLPKLFAAKSVGKHDKQTVESDYYEIF